MSSSEATGEASASLQNIPATYVRLKRQYQQALDRITPHIMYRWIGTAVTIAIFELRILFSQGVRVPLKSLNPSLTYIAFWGMFDMCSGTLVRHSSSFLNVDFTSCDSLQFAVSAQFSVFW